MSSLGVTDSRIRSRDLVSHGRIELARVSRPRDFAEDKNGLAGLAVKWNSRPHSVSGPIGYSSNNQREAKSGRGRRESARTWLA